MAANKYYQIGSSEIQADDNNLQTLHLMHPNFVGYSHAPPLHAPPLPQSAQQFMSIPLVHENHPSRTSPQLQENDQIQAVHNALVQRFHYNTWGISLADQHHQTPAQGLSLSLNSPHQSRTPFDNHRQDFPMRSSVGAMNTVSPGNCSSHQSLTANDDQSTGVISMHSVILGSKYLKAAQELLDEVASVGKSNTGDRTEKASARDKTAAKMMKEPSGEIVVSGSELTTAQRQEIQMKKAKLNAMLDEVEQRYRQYHQQMQIVVASFEQAAGLGSAKSYTHVALKTILKQFRSLKNAISGRIKALNRSLGEEESSSGKMMEGSMRLKFVDHQQRTAMHQQMGMIMHNNINTAWRPQRGLPEKAVSVLRAWLFEHFLHPYPKDADKQMLAKQTGLSRSQVSNWFINARVRLWKPMVEEMYLEEIKSNNNNNQQPHEISSKLPAHDGHPDKLEYSSSKTNPAKKQRINDDPHQENSLASSILSVDEIEPMKQPANHQQTSAKVIFSNVVNKFANIHNHNQQTSDSENYFTSMASSANTHDLISISGLGRFNGGDQYQSMESNFQGNNSFSLSLGLPPSRETSHGNFEFRTRIESGMVESHDDRVRGTMINQGNQNNIGNYETILDFQNRKPYPAHQLLPDFVA